MRKTLIFCFILTALSSIYCQTRDLTPQIKNDLYCFDSIQVRKIAQVVKNEPVKDSLIIYQDDQINDLKSLTHNQDSTIRTQSLIIKNDSLKIEKLENVISLSDDKCQKEINLKIKQTRKKARKPFLISVVANLVLLIVLISK